MFPNMLNQGFAQSSREYTLNVQRGLVPGVKAVHTFGLHLNLPNSSVFETIWSGQGVYNGFDAVVAEPLEVISTSANDTFGGTGANTIIISGLNENYDEVTETIPLSGLTPSVTANNYIRSRIAIVATGGSLGGNEGTITVRQTITTSNVFSVIQPNNNRALNSVYTVPANKEAYIYSGFASMAKKSAANCEVKAESRQFGSVFQLDEWFSINSAGSSYVRREFEFPLIMVPEKTDIRISANSDSVGVSLAAGLEILLIDV